MPKRKKSVNIKKQNRRKKKYSPFRKRVTFAYNKARDVMGVLDEHASSSDENSAFRLGNKQGYRLFFRFCAILVAALIVVFVAFNNKSIAMDVKYVSIPGLSQDLEGFTILYISDLNGDSFGEEQATLMRTVNQEKYDCVVFGGDMVGKGGNSVPMMELVSNLSKTKPLLFVAGDSDPGPFTNTAREGNLSLANTVLADWIIELTNLGAVYVDSPYKLTVGKSNIWFTPTNLLNVNAKTYYDEMVLQKQQEEEGMLLGLDTDYSSLPITTYRTAIARNFMDTAAQMTAEDVHISVGHVPLDNDFILMSQTSRGESAKFFLNAPDLVLSGHYCGGVWKLPIIGRTLYIPSDTAPNHGWFPAKNTVEGLRQVSGTSVYISGGLSTCGIMPLPFRFINQPVISCLKLTGRLASN